MIEVTQVLAMVISVIPYFVFTLFLTTAARHRKGRAWMGIFLIVTTLIPGGLQPLYAQEESVQRIRDAILGRIAVTPNMDCNGDGVVDVLDVACEQGRCAVNNRPDLLTVGNRSIPVKSVLRCQTPKGFVSY